MSLSLPASTASPLPEPSVTELAGVARAAVLASRHADAMTAFEGIVTRLQRRALRIASGYVRQPEDADDVVQDAFVKALSRLEQYDPAQPFEPWFVTVLVRQCLDRLKAQRRRARWLWSGDGPELPDRSPSVEARLTRSAMAQQIWDAVDLLPERQRTVIVLHGIDGQSAREISQATGLAEATVRVHLFRALKRLRQRLGADEAEA